MPSVLILTVGTGTTAQHWNVAQGLVNRLHQLRPRLFGLVPSASSDSAILAEIVHTGFFAPDLNQP